MLSLSLENYLTGLEALLTSNVPAGTGAFSICPCLHSFAVYDCRCEKSLTMPVSDETPFGIQSEVQKR